MDRKTCAEARIEFGLGEIEKAKCLLDSACAAISSVIGLGPEWRKLGRLSDAVQAAWHKLEEARDRLADKGGAVIANEPQEQHEARYLTQVEK